MTGCSITTVRYGGQPSQFIETWEPRTGHVTAVAATLHGGWWRDQHDLHLMDPICRHLAAMGWRVHNIEYRRTGLDGGGWPQTFHDTMEALRALSDHGPASQVLIGHSAGGQLALLAATQLTAVSVVALAPVTDLVASNDQALGEGATADFVKPPIATALEAASPLTQVAMSRQLIVHGTADQRVPIEQSRRYSARAIGRGAPAELHEVAGGDHFCVIDPGQPAWRAIDTWLAALDHDR